MKLDRNHSVEKIEKELLKEINKMIEELKK